MMRKYFIFAICSLAPSMLGMDIAPSINMYERSKDPLFAAPLLSSVQGGTYSGVGAGKTCRVDGAATYSTLGSGAVCQDATYGTRLNEATTNLLLHSNALDTGANWLKTAGVTVTANSVVGPSGNLDAERVQFGAAPQTLYQDVAAGAGLGAFDDIVYSVWMKRHSAGAACTIDLGSSTAVGGIYYGGLVTVTDTWERYWTRGTAQITGAVRWALSNATTYGHGTPTCTDLDVVETQLESDTYGPGQYTVTGAEQVTSSAESITWPWAGKIRAARGTIQLTFTATEKASWDLDANVTLLTVPVDGGGTWGLYWYKDLSMLVFNAGGTTTAVPATWAPWTSHTISVSWQNGRLSEVKWDDGMPYQSAANYTTPTFTAGGSITLGGSLDGFYSSLKIYKTFRTVTPTVSHFTPFLSTLTPSYPVAAADWTYTGGASTCLDSGGQSMSDKALNVPCYYDAAGSARGIRVAPAWTNLVRGDMDGVHGACPTGFGCPTADGPHVNTGVLFHGPSSQYIETAAFVQIAYSSNPEPMGQQFYTYHYRNAELFVSAGDLYTICAGAAGASFSMPLRGDHAWSRFGTCAVMVAAANMYDVTGSSATGFVPPSAGVRVTYDTTSQTLTSYAPPFCAGAPPVTCTTESLSRAMGAELDATSYTIRLTVTTMFGAGTDRGNSGINYGNARGSNAYLISNTGFNVQWNNTDKTWVFTDGTQTATSAAQSFPPDSTHEITIYGVDGFPLMLQVDGQDWVASAGNKAAQALGATTYLLTHSAGGAELGGWVQGVDIR